MRRFARREYNCQNPRGHIEQAGPYSCHSTIADSAQNSLGSMTVLAFHGSSTFHDGITNQRGHGNGQ